MNKATGEGDILAGEPWWKRAVVYQIYPRSFADSNGDGIGDIQGIIARLDYLEYLGVDVIWLSPIYQSPQDDYGYDISDYHEVDPVYGSLADLDELIDAVHRRGMKLIMDLVVNHTSDEHEWFHNSRSSITSQKRDWYWWQPARKGMRPGTPGAEPNNWTSFFSGPAWEFDELTGEYYLHLFSKKQPDLNWENRAVRQAIYEMMRWWLDRGINGFRMDVINLISKPSDLPDGHPLGTSSGPVGSEHYMCGPRIHEYLREMHRDVFAGRDHELLTVGEMPGVTLEEARQFTNPVNHELDMVFQFEHMEVDHKSGRFDLKPLDLRDLKASLCRWQTGLSKVGWNSLYWNNHDQPRVVSRFGDDDRYRVESAKTLATILHLHRGTPYVYQGEEIGMTNAPFDSPDDLMDIESKNYCSEAKVRGVELDKIFDSIAAGCRDNARTPMQWDASPNAGFTTGTPWFLVNPNFREINAANAIADPDSVLHHYRRLIQLRHEDPVVALGDFTMLLESDPHVYAFKRSLEDIELLVLGNFSSEQVRVDLTDAPDWTRSEIVIANYAEPAEDEDGIRLRPWESRVYRRRNVRNVARSS